MSVKDELASLCDSLTPENQEKAVAMVLSLVIAQQFDPAPMEAGGGMERR